MNRIVIIVLSSLIYVQCTPPSDQLIMEQIKTAHEQQNHFRMLTLIEQNTQLQDLHTYQYYKAKAHNLINHLSESNCEIDKLISSGYLSDSVTSEILQIKLDNHLKLFEYSEALETTKKILRTYHSFCSKEDLTALNNEQNMYVALKDVPVQEIVKKKDERLEIHLDKAGLKNIRVGKNGTSFIFDTGANISAITESSARKLGIRKMRKRIDITALTGKKTKAELGVADSLKIGNILIKNVVFLIFKDTDLAFPQIGYQINGIIGYPIISAMQEVTIKKNCILIPQHPSLHEKPNMVMDHLTPVVMVQYENDTLCCSFDTGATHTNLYASFYQKYQKQLLTKGKQDTIRIGGAGGIKMIPSFCADSLLLKIGDSSTSIKKVGIYMHDLKNKEHYYGNIGNDFINQFDEMTINFGTMHIAFR